MRWYDMPMQLSRAVVRQATLVVSAVLAAVVCAVLVVAVLDRPGPPTVLVAQLQSEATTDDRWHDLADAAAAADADLVEILVPDEDTTTPDAAYLSAAIGRPTAVLQAAAVPVHTADVRVVSEAGAEVQPGTAPPLSLLVWLAALALLLSAGLLTLAWRSASAAKDQPQPQP